METILPLIQLNNYFSNKRKNCNIKMKIILLLPNNNTNSPNNNSTIISLNNRNQNTLKFLINTIMISSKRIYMNRSPCPKKNKKFNNNMTTITIWLIDLLVCPPVLFKLNNNSKQLSTMLKM